MYHLAYNTLLSSDLYGLAGIGLGQKGKSQEGFWAEADPLGGSQRRVEGHQRVSHPQPSCWQCTACQPQRAMPAGSLHATCL